MAEKVKDPVCGMKVDKDKAVTLSRNDKTHHFCSEDCKNRFEAESDAHAGHTMHGEHEHAGHPDHAGHDQHSPRHRGEHAEHEEKEQLAKHGAHGRHEHGDHAQHHAHMVADFRRRFWVSLVLTVPVVVLSPMLQAIFGLEETLHFPGDAYVQFALASVIFFYGGWPFLKGLYNELSKMQPGMMTLIAMAITVAYVYSSAVVFGLSGKVFFWELATLIDVMLLGHWIEMRSVMGASRALESLVQLMPAEAHRLTETGATEDVLVSEVRPGDRVLVKPGEKVPIDGQVVEGRTSVNQAMLTGESQPVEKGEGDQVIGGSINGEAAVTIEVQKTGD